MSDQPQDLPHSPEAEVGVLGAILGSDYACGQVVGFLDPADFYVRTHRSIYDAISEVADAGQPVDLVTVIEKLREHGSLDQVGGPGAIASLQAQSQPSHARAYASLVKDRAVGRRLVTFGQAASQAGRNGNIAATLADLQTDLTRLSAYNEDTNAVGHIGDLLDPTFERLDLIEQAGGGLLGVPSGLDDLDRILRGFQSGKLYLIAARPAVGKTTVAQTFINHAVATGRSALFFSMEMDQHELVVRMLASTAKVDKKRMDAGTLDAHDHKKLDQARVELATLPLFIDDRASQTVASIRAVAERTAMANGGLDMVMVDYVGLIDGSGTRGENRQNEMAKISRALKVLSKELDVPVIALSQLSREVEKRPDKRPMLADLRDSGALEQDADAVIMLYRDEMYDENSPDRGLMELILAKHRGGETGVVKAAWLPHMFRVANLARGISAATAGVSSNGSTPV